MLVLLVGTIVGKVRMSEPLSFKDLIYTVHKQGMLTQPESPRCSPTTPEHDCISYHESARNRQPNANIALFPDYRLRPEMAISINNI